jgi:multiple antibiotic resistance protein
MKEFLSTALILFLIMDPIGNVPVFLSVLKTVPEERRKKILVRELVVALLVLLIFFFIGKYLMNFLHLTQESICISGGIILFVIAVKMIFPFSYGDHVEHPDNEPFIVPLAIPLVAGPSALAVILLLPQTPFAVLANNLLALFCAWIVSAAILVSSTRLYAILKIKGLMAMERLMGMLLILMAVQMLLDGIKMMLSSVALK